MSISYPVDKRLSRFTRLAMVVRANDWWAYKIAIILATGYATADVLGVSPVSLWQTFLFLLLSLVPLAAFASLINDLSDIAEDRIAGKRNHLDGMSRLRVLGLFAASLIPGIAIAASLRQTPGLVVIYAANWLIFALYSVPPVRLKSRALLGIIAIALGESFLPHLFALFLTAAAVTREAPPLWTALVVVWSFTVGMRSILWHQLRDHDSDREAGVVTFAVKATPRRVVWLGKQVLFPLEIAAFLGMLCILDLSVAWVLLAVYALTEFLRHWLWKIPVVAVKPAKGDRLVMFEFYDLFYPIACIAGSLHQDPANGILLAFVAFSTKRLGWWCRDVSLMGVEVARRIWHRGRWPKSGS